MHWLASNKIGLHDQSVKLESTNMQDFHPVTEAGKIVFHDLPVKIILVLFCHRLLKTLFNNKFIHNL